MLFSREGFARHLRSGLPEDTATGGGREKEEGEYESVGGNMVGVETDIRTMKGRCGDRVPDCQLQTREMEHTHGVSKSKRDISPGGVQVRIFNTPIRL